MVKSRVVSSLARQQVIYGAGGVPWIQIMGNELKCLVVRAGHGSHFAKKLVKKYCFLEP